MSRPSPSISARDPESSLALRGKRTHRANQCDWNVFANSFFFTHVAASLSPKPGGSYTAPSSKSCPSFQSPPFYVAPSRYQICTADSRDSRSQPHINNRDKCFRRRRALCQPRRLDGRDAEWKMVGRDLRDSFVRRPQLGSAVPPFRHVLWPHRDGRSTLCRAGTLRRLAVVVLPPTLNLLQRTHTILSLMLRRVQRLISALEYIGGA